VQAKGQARATGEAQIYLSARVNHQADLRRELSPDSRIRNSTEGLPRALGYTAKRYCPPSALSSGRRERSAPFELNRISW